MSYCGNLMVGGWREVQQQQLRNCWSLASTPPIAIAIANATAIANVIAIANANAIVIAIAIVIANANAIW